MLKRLISIGRRTARLHSSKCVSFVAFMRLMCGFAWLHRNLFWCFCCCILFFLVSSKIKFWWNTLENAFIVGSSRSFSMLWAQGVVPSSCWPWISVLFWSMHKILIPCSLSLHIRSFEYSRCVCIFFSTSNGLLFIFFVRCAWVYLY